MKKRLICALLSILMLVSLLPVGALAADEGGSTSGESAAAEENTEANEGISLAAEETYVVSMKTRNSDTPKEYATIQEAVTAAGDSNKAWYTLLSDATANDLSFLSTATYLDLGGYTLTCATITIGSTTDADYFGFSLTIQNGTGTINCSGITVGYDGTLAITSDVTILSSGPNCISGYTDKIELTTGTFSTDVSAYCATGYTTQAVTSDGTTLYKVVKDEKVAKIGDTGYSTLTEALNAATDGQTVTVITDVSENVTYSNSNSVTLDLAGYAITLDSLTVSSGTLTITDSGSATTASSLGNITVSDGATLSVIGGTYTTEPSSNYIPTGYSVSGTEGAYTVVQTEATFTIGSYNSDIVTVSSVTLSINGITSIIANNNIPYTYTGHVGDVIEITATATLIGSTNNYAFKGWYYNKDGTGAQVAVHTTSGESYLLSATITLTTNTEVYAVCEASTAKTEACNTWLATATEEDGIYSISSIDNWQNFVYAVNVLGHDFSGKTVKLTASLDFTDYDNQIEAVGTSSKPFKGRFDGQNYTISNMSYVSTSATYVGVFGVVSGATIKDLNVTNSTFEANASSGYAGGIVADAQNNSVIENCTVSNVTVRGWFAGGIAGHTFSSTFNSVAATDVTFVESAKSGCIVGYAEALTVNGATVTSSLTSDSSSGMPAAVVGQANGNETLSNLNITSSGLNVIGTMETEGVYTVTIDGTSTNITAAALTGNLNDSATLAVSAGTYSMDVNEYVVAGSAAVTSDGGKTYTVTTGVVAAVYVDGICTATYTSLEDAIEAAKSGDTVKLLQDVSLEATLNIYKSITLDLGDYTITSTANDKAIYTTQTLTITANENGGITSSNGCAITNQKGQGTGELTIDGGTYTSSANNAIYNNNGTVTIKSGTVSSTYEGGRDGIRCYANATVIIEGGTITGTRYGIYSIYNLEISGGTISSTSTSTNSGVRIEGGTATISGGTIRGNEGLKGTSYVTSITISGGTFEGVTHAAYVCNDSVTVSGGSFTVSGSKENYAVAFYIDGATVTFSGGTFSGMFAAAWIKSGSGGQCNLATGYEVDTGNLTDYNSSDSDLLVRTVIPGDTTLGISDESGIVIAKSIIDKGQATMYAQVSGENVSSYDTDSYPTTSLTMDNSTTGYVFAGWYTLDEDGSYAACDTSMWESTGETDSTYYYAKFVDANVLTVAAQITSETTASSETTDMRFLSSVDELDFSGVGFYITINGITATVSTKTVYESISAAGSDYTPSSVFSSASKYFIAYTLMSIPKDVFDSEITVTAYWETTDGTTVSGETNAFTISNMYKKTSE